MKDVAHFSLSDVELLESDADSGLDNIFCGGKRFQKRLGLILM